jgi:ribosomal protein S18 acetylase RimI-like enzyme
LLFKLRHVKDGADEGFLLRVFREGHGTEFQFSSLPPAQLEALFEIQHRAQQASYRSRYPQSDQLLISVADEPAGRLWFAETPDEVRILDVALLSAFRSRGIGTAILRDLQKLSQNSQRPLRLAVAQSNKAALRFYLRSGFVERRSHPFHIEMEFLPDPDGNLAA